MNLYGDKFKTFPPISGIKQKKSALIIAFLFFFNILFYFWEKERDRAWVGERQREGDTECEAGSRLWVVSAESDMGLEPTSCEIMTWAEVECLTDRTTQAPLIILFQQCSRGFSYWNKTRKWSTRHTYMGGTHRTVFDHT